MSYAFYFQNTLDLNQYSTSISFGARTENTDFGGRDEVNRGVTGFSFATDHDTYDIKRSNIARVIKYFITI